jgi:hypothetical protein
MGRIDNPDEAGRGPGRMMRYYLVQVGELDFFQGQFIGVVLGTTKGADTLVFQTDDQGNRRLVAYRELTRTWRLEDCHGCGRRTMLRHDIGDWQCSGCGATAEHDPRPLRRRRAWLTSRDHQIALEARRHSEP